MKAFHLNSGVFLSLPSESRYSMARRLFIANPGIPLPVLKQQLNQYYPTLNFAEQVKAIQPNSLAWTGDIFCSRPIKIRPVTRHCSQCAKGMFHSDLFHLPWLQHCPLHQCAFTEICPECGEDWPASTDILYSRRCPVCGIPRWAEIMPAVLEAMASQNYAPMECLQRLIGSTIQPECYWIDEACGTQYDGDKLECPDPMAYDYPAYLCSISPAKFRPLLNPLGIAVPAFHVKSSCVSTVETTPPGILAHTLAQWHHRMPRYARCEYKVTLALIHWIRDRTCPGHTLKLYSGCERERLWGLAQEPAFCSYCFAFSLWFVHVVRSAFYMPHDRLRYKFCRLYADLGVPVVPIKPRPLLQVGDNLYKPTQDFYDWFYRHQLMTAFANFFLFALRTQLHINQLRQVGFMERLTSRFDELHARLNGSWIQLDAKVLSYYYISDNPLQDIISCELKHLAAENSGIGCDQCAVLWGHLGKHDSPGFYTVLGQAGLTYSAFSDIQADVASKLFGLP